MSCQQVVATSHYRLPLLQLNPFFTLRGSNHDDNPRRHPIKRAVERVGGLLRCRDKWVVVGERKRKTPEGLSAVDTPSSPSYALSLSLSSFNGAPLTKETCSLQAAAAHVHLLRDDALLTILGQDSLSLTFSFNLYVHVYICISSLLSLSLSLFVVLCLSVDDTLPRAGCSSGLYFASRGFCGLPGKGQPTPSMYHPPAPSWIVGSRRAVTSRRSAKGNWEEGSTSWKLELVSIFIHFRLALIGRIYVYIFRYCV